MQEFLKFFDLTPLDATMILVAIPLFVLFLKTSEKYLIKPFLDRINQREALTTGAGSSAESIIQEAAALEQEYQHKIDNARMAAVRERAGKITQAREQASKILHDAEEQVAQQAAAERGRTRQQLESQREQLLRDVDTLAQGIVRKLMKPRGLSVLIFLFSALFYLNPQDAYASGTDASHGYGYLFWYWINFLVYVGVMYLILRNFVAKGWDDRRDKIRFALEAGKRSLEQATTRRSLAKGKLDQLERESQELVSSIECDGQNEVQKILDDAQAHALEIQADASETLVLEARAQNTQMQREIAEIVLTRATALLKAALDKESDQILRQGALAGVKNLIH